MLLVAASVLLGEFLTIEQIPQKVAASIIDFTNNTTEIIRKGKGDITPFL